MNWLVSWFGSAIKDTEPLHRLFERQAEIMRDQVRFSERLNELIALAESRTTRLEERLATLDRLGNYRRNVDLVERDGLFFYVYEGDLAHSLTPAPQRRQHVSLPPTALAEAVGQATRSDIRRDLDRHDPVARAIGTLSQLGTVNLVYVGINYGFHLLALADHIRKNRITARIVAFDPGIAGELVPATLRLNGVSEMIEFHRLALGNVSGYAILEEVVGHSEDNKLVNMSDSPLRSSRLVETRRFDDFAAVHGLSGPTVLVLDTQGAEPEILEGSSAYLASNPSVLISEFTPWALGSRMLAQDFLRRLLILGRVFDLGTLANLGITSKNLSLIGEEVTAGTADDYAARIFRTDPNWSDVMVLPRAEPFLFRLLAGFGIGT